ncbi:hypothetical protein GCM10009735_12330 [Actinomadura chokoriensis]|jgi:hypothetical protein
MTQDGPPDPVARSGGRPAEPDAYGDLPGMFLSVREIPCLNGANATVADG